MYKQLLKKNIYCRNKERSLSIQNLFPPLELSTHTFFVRIFVYFNNIGVSTFKLQVNKSVDDYLFSISCTVVYAFSSLVERSCVQNSTGVGVMLAKICYRPKGYLILNLSVRDCQTFYFFLKIQCSKILLFDSSTRSETTKLVSCS